MQFLNMGWSKLLRFLRIDIRDVIIGFFAIVFFLLFLSVFTYAYFAGALQNRDTVMNKNDTGVVLLDRNNKPLFTFDQGHYKSFVQLSQIPQVTQDAIVVEEDKNFYHEAGFSIRAILGAMIADIRYHNLDYGGSTITQQLVKNVLLNSNKSFLRKYQELVLAQELERRYSKDQILEMYLNSVYLGNGAFGVDEAANTYFGENVQNLDLAQSAMLAAILPAPTELSPIGGDLAKAKSRQSFVLDKMREAGYITQAQEVAAQNEQLSFKDGTIVPYEAPHFALMVEQELIDKYGEETVARSGFKVKTTLNLDWQTYAQEQVKEGVARLKGDIVSNGAAIVMDPKTGEILAYVGSEDWNNSQFGKFDVVQSPRQPGSSFKPIVYSAALEERLITPATMLQDVPTVFNNCPGATPEQLRDPNCRYAPHDYDNRFWGPVTVRRALSNSRNVPSVEVMSKVGVPSALEMAQRLGITTLNGQQTDYGLSLVLGAGDVRLLDMATVYSVFANGGYKTPPTSILEIDDKDGNVIYRYQPSSDEVLDPGVAFLISSILSDAKSRAEEFGNALNISRLAAVKTGTTENYKDAWTMGYTPSLVVGVWVGNNDGTPMDQVAGSLGAAPIWRALMERFLAGTPVETFTMPDDVVAVTACNIVAVAAPSPSPSSSPSPSPTPSVTLTSAYKEYFLAGTEPLHQCATSNSSPNPTFSPYPFPSPSNVPPPAGAVQGVQVQQNNSNGGNNVNIVNGTPVSVSNGGNKGKH